MAPAEINVSKARSSVPTPALARRRVPVVGEDVSYHRTVSRKFGERDESHAAREAIVTVAPDFDDQGRELVPRRCGTSSVTRVMVRTGTIQSRHS